MSDSRKEVLKSDIMNAFIAARGYVEYLEIGVDMHTNFNKIKCENKESVDSNPHAHPTYCMKSDEFWATNDKKYDIICIDGYHRGNQVYRDIAGSLNCLKPNGLILVHDCLPKGWKNATIEMLVGDWTGDVWNGFAAYRPKSKYRTYTIKVDRGCGIIDTKYGPFDGERAIDHDSLAMKVIEAVKGHCTYLSWDFYEQNKQEILTPISVDEFVELYNDEFNK